MVRQLIVPLTLVSLAGCMPMMAAKGQKVWGDSTNKTVEQRDKERQIAAAGVAQAQAVSAETKSATELAKFGNNLCFAPGMANYAGAQSAYREGLEYEPNNTYVLASQATCYVRQGLEEKFSGKNGEPTTDTKRLREAKKWFKRAMASCRAALKANLAIRCNIYRVARTRQSLLQQAGGSFIIFYVKNIDLL